MPSSAAHKPFSHADPLRVLRRKECIPERLGKPAATVHSLSPSAETQGCENSHGVEQGCLGRGLQKVLNH